MMARKGFLNPSQAISEITLLLFKGFDLRPDLIDGTHRDR